MVLVRRVHVKKFGLPKYTDAIKYKMLIYIPLSPVNKTWKISLIIVLMRKNKSTACKKNGKDMHDFVKAKVCPAAHGLIFLPGASWILHFPYPNFATMNCLA